MSTTSRFARPTNIGTFFPLFKLIGNCHGLFRRNVPYGQDVSRAQSLYDLREFEPSVRALFGGVDVACLLFAEINIRLDNAVRRLIRADR